MKTYVFIFVVFFSFLTSCKNDKKKGEESATKVENNIGIDNKRILILGNSITQNGAYVTFMEYYLKKHATEQPLDIISIGLSGETVSGTSEPGREHPRPNVRTRLERALNATEADLVLACYGMNDANYHPLDSLRFAAYKKGILELKHKVESYGAQLILLTPTVFDPYPIQKRVSTADETHEYWHPYSNYNTVLTTYSDWLLDLETENLQVIDLHHNLNSILERMKQIKSDSTFVPDGVHPNKIGHFYMAKTILNDLYPSIPIKDSHTELKRIERDPLYKLVAKRRELRSEGWLNYIGYTKNGEMVKSDAILPVETKVRQLDEAIAILLKQ